VRILEPTAARIAVTPRATRAVSNTRKSLGDHTVVMTWPAGATMLPADQFVPSAFDVIVGHVAQCAVFADARQLELFAAHHVLIDVETNPRPSRRPILRVRHEVVEAV